MGNRISKENQSSEIYRFGDFELDPADRLLTSKGSVVPLPPKTFDALLLLVQKAEHLVTKRELMDALWPSTFVTEANLTNTIVSLRKILGRDALQTVSKHGYRLMLPVLGQPGIRPEVFEHFARARELTLQRSLDSTSAARELYWVCLAEDPSFAAAWAWLGRCCWFLAKFSGKAGADLQISDAALRRAFLIDPDLACAHQFYTPVQTDLGRASSALSRLLDRVARNPAEPESFVGLVQVFRFCGLLRESVDAHQRASELDPAVSTSLAHTLFLDGQYEAAIESYGGRAGYYLDAAAWAALGDTSRALSLLRTRVQATSLSPLMQVLMGSLLALLEGRCDDAVACMRAMRIEREPEALVYLARHFSYMDRPDCALEMLESALDSGFVCSPKTLRSDRWFDSVRSHAAFPPFLARVETLTAKTHSAIPPAFLRLTH